MEVYGKFSQKVIIKPEIVIQNLIDDVTGYRGWIKEDGGKFWRCWEESAGHHYINQREEITVKEYEYYVALKLVLKNLKSKK